MLPYGANDNFDPVEPVDIQLRKLRTLWIVRDGREDDPGDRRLGCWLQEAVGVPAIAFLDDRTRRLAIIRLTEAVEASFWP